MVFSELRQLDLSGSFNVVDSTIKALTQSASSLENLNVAGCGQLTDLALKYIGSGLPMIRSLQFASTNDNWDFISDRGLKHLSVNGAKFLEKLVLSRNNQITHKGVLQLSKIPSLKILQLADCGLIDDGLCVGLSVPESFPSLKVLDISRCHGISDCALMKMIAAREVYSLAPFVVLGDGRLSAGRDAPLSQQRASENRAQISSYATRAEFEDNDMTSLGSVQERRLGINRRS
jgi:hypothetical protein